jgi:hypothetical protein
MFISASSYRNIPIFHQEVKFEFERESKKLGDEILSMHLFESLDHVQQKANQWICKYNNKRPHRSLNRMSPRAFLLKYGKLNEQELREFPTFQQDNNNSKQEKLYF